MPSRSRRIAWPTLALALWLGPAARADAGLKLSVSPARLLLGTDTEAKLRIEVEPGTGPVEAWASVGVVGEPKAVGRGVFEARYSPPRQRFPQLAILAVLAQTGAGPVHGWIVLPLWGQGAAEVRTRPATPVTLTIGDRRFGPVTADARGVARVPVIAPPGVREALYGSQRYDLGVPELPLTYAIVESRTLPADREQQVRVRVFQVAPDGTPSDAPSIRLTASRGTLEPPRLVEKGVLEARWTIPPGPPGEIELTGTLPSSAVPVFSRKVVLTVGAPRHFSLQLDRERASPGDEVGIEVQARDEAGNPAPVVLRAEAGSGLSAALRERTPGVHVGSLTIPSRFDQGDSLELRVLVQGIDAPVASRTLPLVPAPPLQVDVETMVQDVVADGRGAAGLRVQVSDRFGNPVRQPPRIVGSEPLGEPVPVGPGAWELRWVPPRRETDGRIDVTVHAGETEAATSQPLLGARTAVAVSARIGVLTNFRDVVGLDVALQAELWPRLLARDLGLRLEAGYLYYPRGAGAQTPGFEGRNQAFSVLLGPIWRFVPKEKLRVWAFVGAGAALIHCRTWMDGVAPLSEQGGVPTVQGAVGFAGRLGPGLPFIEARVAWYHDPGLDNLRGAIVGGGLALGYRLEGW